MKFKLKHSIILLSMLLGLVSCNMGGIEVPSDKKEYIGSWKSQSMQLLILKDGSVKYERIKSGTTTSVSGPIQKFEGNNFIVGALGINTTFVVSKTPHEEDGVWKMTVDDEELTKE